MRRTILSLTLIALFLCCSAAAMAADTVCIECHSGQEGALAAPVAEWHGSVHAGSGISCHDCHGGDPADYVMAMSPERGFIGVPAYDEVPAFCGRCHVGVMEAYLPGKHGQALERGGAQCVVCHQNHEVHEANLELINETSCSRCHDYVRAESIKSALSGMDSRIEAVAVDLERQRRLGFDTEDMGSALFDLRNRFHRVFHGVDTERIRRETGDYQAELEEIASGSAALDEIQSRRRLWGGAAIAVCLFAGVVLLLVRRTYEEEERG